MGPRIIAEEQAVDEARSASAAVEAPPLIGRGVADIAAVGATTECDLLSASCLLDVGSVLCECVLTPYQHKRKICREYIYSSFPMTKSVVYNRRIYFRAQLSLPYRAACDSSSAFQRSNSGVAR